jgi:hypothetical protein
MPLRRSARRASFVALLILPTMTVAVSAQSIAKTKQQADKSGQEGGKISTTSTAALARPTDWGSGTFRLLRKDSRQVTFALVTSWIPGENHKGMLRYKLRAFPAPSIGSSAEHEDMNTPEAVENLMNRVHDCIISLELYDKDGFILRKHDIPFGFGVDAQEHLLALVANDSFQMDAEDYRKWIFEKGGGSWTIGWDCGPKDLHEK